MSPAGPDRSPAGTLIFDGDCGFCRRTVERWRRRFGDRIEILALQEAGERFPAIPRADLEQAVHFVEPDGRTTRGAEAVCRALAVDGPGRLRLLAYERVPGAAWASEHAYAFVAKRRVLFSRLSRWLYGHDLAPDEHLWSRWVFLKLLGFVYLLAFLSLWVQVEALIGERGVLPVARFVELAREQAGTAVWRRHPTFCLFDASDVGLHLQCAGGVALAVVLLLGFAPRWSLLGMWALYLSLTTAGQDFLSFQWDVLLLETGLLAVLLAPPRVRRGVGRERAPSRLVVSMLHWLLFRLMLTSGVAKLTAPALPGEVPAWHDLTALAHHYETQPLPNPLAWPLHQLPLFFHELSAVLVLAVEIAVPLFVFLPRRPRKLACALFVLLQLLIAATGNYGFFNLLTVALCVLLLDDVFWRRRLPARLVARGPAVPAPHRAFLPARIVLVPAALLAVAVSGLGAWGRFDRDFVPPRPLGTGLLAVHDEYVRPFRSLNTYGLFAHMTTSRPEVVIEGSADGVEWKEYVFRWKPGPLDRRPPQVAPHMPRVDWQLWFAHGHAWDARRWSQGLMLGLLEGRAPVRSLFAVDPFPDEPPRSLRAFLYDYRFTTPEERAETGHYWKRERLGVYCPPIRLRK